mgnify:CR=1 FL=1
MKERTVLLVANNYPPANVPGATRAARLVRHLPALGWRPIVITTTSADGSGSDDSEDGVIRVRRIDTREHLAIAGRYPAFLAFPDRWVASLPGAVRRGLGLLRRQRIDAVCSTSPPVTPHLVARALRLRTTAPWVLELRDPWNLAAPFGPVLRALDRRLARRLLGAADRVVVTTDLLADELRAVIGPQRVRVVPNGFDERDFAGPAPTPDGRFTLLHAGHVGAGYRDPVELLRAVRLCRDAGLLPADVRVRLLGVPEDTAAGLCAAASGLGLGDAVETAPRVSTREAIAAMRVASLLVVLQEKATFAHSVPSKVWEYLRSGRAVVAIAPPGGATHAALCGVPGVRLAPENRAATIAPLLAEAYAAWRARPEHTFVRDLEAWRAESIAARFAAVLDEVAHDA